jgi:hypothetical protein
MPFQSNSLTRIEHQNPGPYKQIPQTYGSTATVTNGSRPVLVNVEATRPVVQLLSLLSTGTGNWLITEGSGRAALQWTLAATAGTRQTLQVAGESIRVSFGATAAGTATAVVASFI